MSPLPQAVEKGADATRRGDTNGDCTSMHHGLSVEAPVQPPLLTPKLISSTRRRPALASDSLWKPKGSSTKPKPAGPVSVMMAFLEAEEQRFVQELVRLRPLMGKTAPLPRRQRYAGEVCT